MNDSEVDGNSRTTRRFEWSAVAPELIHRLLVAAYESEERDDEAQLLADMSAAQLVRQATKSLGRPPLMRHMEALFETLRDFWLPTVRQADLKVLIWDLQLTLSGSDRVADPRNKAERLDFLRRRKRTENFLRLLRASFIRAHKVEVTAASTAGARSRWSGILELVGTGVVDRHEPYDHQRDAWRGLDALAARQDVEQRRGLVVLPTGAGKTYTAVAWLLEQLSEDPQLRVLWIADQQELLEQAAASFAEHAATMAPDITRRLRVVHGGASPISSLAEEGLDVVCATRQSLVGRGLDAAREQRLKAFMSRPCIVVVDEAHHAVSPSYRTLLEFIWGLAPDTVTLGLTATPWPSGHRMTQLLRQMFPTEVIEIGVREMVKSGVLARPVFHTVGTGEYVELDPKEIEQAVGRDLPASVLRRLDRFSRNHLIVNTWLDREEEWGKTLVFACTIEHADRLGAVFQDAGVPTSVVHSASEVERSVALREFRDRKDAAVLVSVGMLLEGVDVPDARTAFLARPTTSPIVMRQMIGRVLRGPAAGGESLAHVVDLRDRWDTDIDVLAPVEIPLPEGELEILDAGPRRLPPVLADDGDPIGEDVLRRIEKEFAEIRKRNPLPHAAALARTELVGFFGLTDLNIPVFDHTRDAWDELVGWALGRNELGVRAAIDLFDDLPVPRPTKSDVQAVVDYARSHQVEPMFTEVRHTLSVRRVAQELIDLGPLTEQEKINWLREKYESSLARSAYASFQAFCEAVQHEVLALAGGIDNIADPETPRPVGEPGKQRPRLSRRPTRDLAPVFQATVAQGRSLLSEAGEFEYLVSLERQWLPKADWTRRPVKSTFAYWAPRISGKSRGTPQIRVNRLLQAPSTQVSDDLLQFLLWHELCHHLLPAHGHDAAFRRLEAMWPEFARLDHELDTLVERFDLRWESTDA